MKELLTISCEMTGTRHKCILCNATNLTVSENKDKGIVVCPTCKGRYQLTRFKNNRFTIQKIGN